MAHVQFTDVQDRPLECLDLSSLTLDEFQQLLPPFEDAFQAHMAAWQTPPRHPGSSALLVKQGWRTPSSSVARD